MTKAKRVCAYRNRAENFRILADSSRWKSERLTLRALAVAYDRLADKATEEPVFPTAGLVVRAP